MPACFCQDAVGKTLINVCYCDIAETVLVCQLCYGHFLKQTTKCYFNNMKIYCLQCFDTLVECQEKHL